MAHFTISNAAGTGMYVPYADASIDDIIQSDGITEFVSDDGSSLVADMAGTSTDVTAHYEQLGTSLFNFTEFGFSVGGTSIGSITEVNLMVDRTIGEEFQSKVINASDDTFQGNDYADWIHGGAGNDIMYGGGADDVLFGDSGNDAQFGGSGNDMLWGDSDNDVLWGEDGQDYIDGGTGNDTMYGGGADDDLFGDSGDDVLWGEDGQDDIDGEAGNDIVYGGGADDVLFGYSGDDVLWGGTGQDYIGGEAGTDAAAFNRGLREYEIIWFTDGDTIVTDLFGDQGSDYVLASTEYLAFTDGNILNTGVFGFHNGNFTGSAGNDTFFGASGNNKVRGGAGFDWLQGGRGNDALYGGANTDWFVFDLKPAKSNKDAIKDFSVKDDFIVLENAVFKVGRSLSAAEFRVNTTGKAQDRNDKIIYDKDSGVLYYDANGSASGSSTAFATIGKNLKLSYHDFDII